MNKIIKYIYSDLERLDVSGNLLNIIKWYIADMGIRAVILYRISNWKKWSKL